MWLTEPGHALTITSSRLGRIAVEHRHSMPVSGEKESRGQPRGPRSQYHYVSRHCCMVSRIGAHFPDQPVDQYLFIHGAGRADRIIQLPGSATVMPVGTSAPRWQLDVI
ncbi:hypothetical protein GCM10010404_83590 [Nonomuraea africana]